MYLRVLQFLSRCYDFFLVTFYSYKYDSDDSDTVCDPFLGTFPKYDPFNISFLVMNVFACFYDLGFDDPFSQFFCIIYDFFS